MQSIQEQPQAKNSGGPTAALPSILKTQNRQMVLACFRDNQEHCVAEVVARTGISKLTVMRAIHFFCGKKILVSTGKGSSTEQGGKKPERFRFSSQKYLLTIMLWPESLGLTLFDMHQRVISSSSRGWIIPDTPEETFRYVGQHALALLAQAGADCEDLYGVSLSTSGIVDYSRLELKYSVHSPGWGTNIPVGAYLREIFGPSPVYFVENAGKSISRAILSEQAEQAENILVLFTSWGLSGALMQNGQILSGRDSLIGEIGHMILDPSDWERCSCGSYGCVERLVSVARLRKMMASDTPPADSPLASIAPEAVTLHHLFAASRLEDPYARTYVTYLADRFAALIRNISLSFNPEKVVFVGDYALADDWFDQRIKSRFADFHYLASSQPIEIQYDTRSLPTLDARGGILALIEHFLSQPELYADAK